MSFIYYLQKFEILIILLLIYLILIKFYELNNNNNKKLYFFSKLHRAKDGHKYAERSILIAHTVIKVNV